MADPQLQELTTAATLAETDVMYAVLTPGGTPGSRQITKANLRKTLIAPAIDLASQASTGAGTVGSPWDIEGFVPAEYIEYHARTGYYTYATSPNWLKTGLVLRGEAGTIFKHTGTGNGFVMDSPTSWDGYCTVENITLLGNANTTNAFLFRGVVYSRFNGLRVLGCNNAGLWSESCLGNELNTFRCNEDTGVGSGFQNATPLYGIVLTSRNDGGTDQTTTWTITNAGLRRMTTKGIWFKDTFYNTARGGDCELIGEFTGGVGVHFGAAGHYNRIEGIDLEFNGTDALVEGDRNRIDTCYSTGTITVNGNRNILTGGQFTNLTLTTTGGTCEGNVLIGPDVQGTYTAGGTGTVEIRATATAPAKFPSILSQLVDILDGTGVKLRATAGSNVTLSNANYDLLVTSTLATNSAALRLLAFGDDIYLENNGPGDILFRTQGSVERARLVKATGALKSLYAIQQAAANSANNRVASNIVLWGATTDAATAKELTTDGAAGSAATNRIAVPASGTLSVELHIAVKQTGSANAWQMRRRFVITNNGGATAIQGSVQTVGTDEGSAGLNTVTCTVTANNTDDCIKIEVNGVAATSLLYTAHLISVEAVY